MIRIEDILDQLVTEDPGVLNLNYLWAKLCRKLNEVEFEELLVLIKNKDTIKTIILGEPYSRAHDGKTNDEKLKRLLNSIRANVNIIHLIQVGDEFGAGSLREVRKRRFKLLVNAIANPNLKCLSLPENQLAHIGMKRLRIILGAIKANKNIKFLDLSKNSIGDLENCLDIEEDEDYSLTSFTSFIENNETLKFLNLCSNGINDNPTFAKLACALANNNSLEYLDLSWNNLGLLEDKSFNILIDALRENKKIMHVKIDEINTYRLSLERLKMLREILIPKVSPITHLGYSMVRTLKNIQVKDSKIGKVLPRAVIKNILSFCPLHKRLVEQAVEGEFSKPLKPTINSSSHNADEEAQIKNAGEGKVKHGASQKC